MKKSHFLQKMFVCMMAFLVGALPVASTYALTEQQLDRFAQNNILFYDPSGGCGGSSGGGTVSVLPGNDNAEKIWNWFASAGIAGVSDNANVIAGIMGNLQQESSFNPFARNSGGCVGLYQACGTRAATLKKAFLSAGISDNYWGTSGNAPVEVIDTAIDITLETMAVGADSSSFRNFMGYINKASEDTPQAYSDLFLAIDERAYAEKNAGSPLLEPAAREYVLNDGNSSTDPDYYQNADTRRTFAVGVFNKYSGSTITVDPNIRIKTDIKTVVCGGSGELVAGGMTLDQAVQFMQAYRNIQPRNYHEPGGDILNNWHINNVSSCASDLENCVAFVQYFICEYGNVCMGLPNGGEVVGHLLSSGRGFIDGGTTPRPYAIFSNSSHTGVVLGVDTASNKIIIGEAGCGKNITYSWTNAHEYPLSDWTSGRYRYAYTDNIIRL